MLCTVCGPCFVHEKKGEENGEFPIAQVEKSLSVDETEEYLTCPRRSRYHENEMLCLGSVLQVLQRVRLFEKQERRREWGIGRRWSETAGSGLEMKPVPVFVATEWRKS